ncbi:MAG: IS4 family transposase [Nanoarchaeota archaeon]|nr:IS4 family transposase [Nanoarchaeota archaeon]
MKRKKKKSKKFISYIRNQIYSKQFLESNRKSDKDFTRKRKLTFPKIILFMLNSIKKSLQKELTEFFLNFSNEKNITNSAFCQSRMKLSHTAFIELNDGIIKEFYTDNIFNLWNGFRLLAIDGSRLQLPLSLELIEDFGFAENQGAVPVPMAQASYCYDLLNSMIINSEIDRYETSEYNLALKHLQKCQYEKDLLIYDRYYDGMWFMFYHLLKKKDFIIRMARNSITEVQNFFNSDEESKIIEITKLHIDSKNQLKKLGLEFNPFKIRLVKVILDNGEVEVLATSLLDEKKYPNKEFKWLYGKRWGIETNFDHLKNHLMIEDFTGLSSLSVLQDFFVSMFMANMQQIFISEAQDELKKQKKDTEYEYKINKNLSFGFMKDRFVKILLDKNADRNIKDLKELFKINPSPIRKGRNFPRVFHQFRKKFYMKKKRAV